MAYSSERWSRGCGTGIGLSGHKNQYRLGVGIENWVEDSYSQGDALAGQSTLWGTPGKPADGTSTYTNSFENEEKKGAGILDIADRKDLQAYPGTAKGHLFSHGLDPANYDSATHYATVNQLVHGQPHASVPKVSQNLWHGTKFNDAGVATNGDGKTVMMQTATTKIGVEKAEMGAYITTNAAVHGTTGSTMLAGVSKEPLAPPQGVGGQATQAGRKATGEMVETFNKTHMQTGLRKPI